MTISAVHLLVLKLWQQEVMTQEVTARNENSAPFDLPYLGRGLNNVVRF